MRRFATIVSLLLGVTACKALAQGALPPSPPVPNSRPTVRDILLVTDSEGVHIEITTDAHVVPQNTRLEHPDRLVFDFPGLGLQGPAQRIPVNQGPVAAVRSSLFQAAPPIARVVIDLKEAVAPQIQSVGNKVSIRIPFGAAARKSQQHDQDAEIQPPDAASSIQPSQQKPLDERSKAASSNSAVLSEYDLLAKARSVGLNDLPALEAKAEAGDPEAQTILALAYHAGVLLKNDEVEALRLLRLAADRGFVGAQESLGIFCAAGIGMEHPDPQQAIAWYSAAATKGSVDAATNIGSMYAMGDGVPKDMAAALQWFRKAADGGGASAEYNLALIYQRGDGVPRDAKQSLYWLNKAADHDFVPALVALAHRFAYPQDGSSPDTPAAIQRYKRAAELGDAVSQAILGDIFSGGDLVKADYEQATKWYRMAAEQGQRDGEFGLGARYYLGQGVAADQNEAFRWFKAAADHGHADAQYDLGAMYETGQGTDPDIPSAVHYYELAAQQGMVKAQYRLGVLLAKGEAVGRNRVAAYKWFMLSQDSIAAGGQALNDLRHSMSATEIDEAEHQVDQWRIAWKQAHPRTATANTQP